MLVTTMQWGVSYQQALSFDHSIMAQVYWCIWDDRGHRNTTPGGTSAAAYNVVIGVL